MMCLIYFEIYDDFGKATIEHVDNLKIMSGQLYNLTAFYLCTISSKMEHHFVHIWPNISVEGKVNFFISY